MPAVCSVTFRSLLSAAVVAAEMREPGDPAQLLPAEMGCLGRAAAARAAEFAAGRLCARSALRELGIIDFPLQVAPDRHPLWPPSVVGSITHTDGFCAAAVADRRRLLGIGIDTEVVAPMSQRLRARICVPAESDWLGSLPEADRAAAAMLIFSAKEAFYKCQYPLVGERLGFGDLYVEPTHWKPLVARPAGGAAPFVVRPTRPIALAHRVPVPVHGRYRFHQQYVSTAIELSADAT
jgi:4'-phosphopantetheinyl transferase EntD